MASTAWLTSTSLVATGCWPYTASSRTSLIWGVCFSEQQKEALDKYVHNTIFELMHTQGHPLFDQMLADVIMGRGQPTTSGDGAPQAGSEVTPTPAAKKARVVTHAVARGCGAAAGSTDLQSVLAAKLASLDE